MKLRNFLIMALSCSVMVMAAGDSNGTGGMNGQNGSMDTMSLSGTVSELNTTDSMLIVQTEDATDTLYITSSTQLPPEQQLTQGSRVEARYVEKEGRKELVSVKVQNAQGTFYRKTLFKNTTSNGSKNGSNGQGEMTLSGTIEQINSEDSTIEIKPKNNGSETIHFDKDTKMEMDQLTEGTKVRVKYREMQDRKVATEISVKNEQNGQNGQNGKNGENGQKKSNGNREKDEE